MAGDSCDPWRAIAGRYSRGQIVRMVELTVRFLFASMYYRGDANLGPT